MIKNYKDELKEKTDKELEFLSKELRYYNEEDQKLILEEIEFRKRLSSTIEDKEETIIVKEESKLKKISIKDILPSKRFLFTPFIVLLNLFVFILMCSSGVNFIEPSVDSLIDWGGNLRNITLQGEYWRLLTATILHGGIIHLIFNLYALILIGIILEPIIGKKKYIFTYFISSIFASVFSLYFNTNVVSVGASGAIFGMLGLIFILISFKIISFPNISNKNLMISVGIFVLYNLLSGIQTEGVDNAAHIGGLICGIFIGLTMALAKKIKLKLIYTFLFLIITISGFSFTLLFNSHITVDFNKTILSFYKNESKTLWMKKIETSNINTEKIYYYKSKIDKDGIDVWQDNIDLLNSIEELSNRNEELKVLLLEYSELRVKSCKVFKEYLFDQSQEKISEFNILNESIERKLQEISSFNKN